MPRKRSTQEEDELVTNEEIAEIFGKKIGTVYSWFPFLPPYVKGNLRWLSEVEKAVDDFYKHGIKHPPSPRKPHKSRKGDRLVNNREIAEYFGKSTGAVSTWRFHLPDYVKPGSNLRWLSDVIEAHEKWEEERKGRHVSDEVIDEIRGKYFVDDWTQRRIGEYFGLDHSTISKILSNDKRGSNGKRKNA